MNLLERLTKVANTLDQKGLFEEAATLDDIVKEAAMTPAQRYQSLNKSMTEIMVKKIIDELKGGGQDSARLGVQVANSRGKDFFATKNNIQQLVSQNPSLRGAFNAGLAAVNPHMNDLVQYKQQLQQAQKPGFEEKDFKGLSTEQEWNAAVENANKEETVDMYSKYEKRLNKKRGRGDPNVKKHQESYNKWLALAKKHKIDTSGLPPPLKTDGIKGRKTNAAFAAFNKLRIAKQVRDAIAGKGARPAPAQKQGPIERGQEEVTQKQYNREYDAQAKALEKAYYETYKKQDTSGRLRKALKKRIDVHGEDPMTASQFVARMFNL